MLSRTKGSHTHHSSFIVPFSRSCLSLHEMEKRTEYVVRDVVDRVMSDGGIFYYRVQWYGYDDPDDDTWEPKAQLIEDGHIANVCEINAYVSWRDQLITEARSLSAFRRDRNSGTSVRFADDTLAICAFATLRKAATLLKVSGFMEAFDPLRRFPSGMSTTV